jgi:hypothetical protein
VSPHPHHHCYAINQFPNAREKTAKTENTMLWRWLRRMGIEPQGQDLDQSEQNYNNYVSDCYQAKPANNPSLMVLYVGFLAFGNQRCHLYNGQ